jgi:hypothetical protein
VDAGRQVDELNLQRLLLATLSGLAWFVEPGGLQGRRIVFGWQGRVSSHGVGLFRGGQELGRWKGRN